MANPLFTPIDPRKRALAKFTVGDDCWLWTSDIKHGYGYLYLDGRSVRAHRFMYEWFVGPIPDGLVIDHLCGVRNCVRPDHLEAVTQRENVLRGAGPPRRTHCPQGHPYDETNTYLTPQGGRACRACSNRRRRARTAAVAAAKAALQASPRTEGDE